jgi:hypothetical protein
VEAAAAQNEKFLYTDQSFLYATLQQPSAMQTAATKAHAAFDAVQSLTARYSALEDGKWAGIMSSAPRERHVFEMPRTATLTDSSTPLPTSWDVGDPTATVSIAASHFTRKFDGTPSHWNILSELGISGSSVEYGSPGLLANQTTPSEDQPWLSYARNLFATDLPTRRQPSSPLRRLSRRPCANAAGRRRHRRVARGHRTRLGC